MKLPDYPERVLIDISGKCNLKCPMCLVHGNDDEEIKNAAIGEMAYEDVQKIMEELPSGNTLIQPNMWGEPTLTPRFKDHIKYMKDLGLSIAVNTNGLTLNETTARHLVECDLDSLFFSIDASTPETLMKVRGIDKLDKIKRNILMMLDIRGDKSLPRIGATFTIQNDNENEVDDFIDFWIQKVDVVRVGTVFEDGQMTRLEVPKKRVPCGALYHTLPIHYNGDALICCLDGLAEHTVGNVLTDGGVKAVWNGEALNKVRHFHETGQYDKVPICDKCNAWAGYIYEEKIIERKGVELLVRHSPQFDYYNRLDRLESWKESLKGHKPPDIEKLTARKKTAAQ